MHKLIRFTFFFAFLFPLANVSAQCGPLTTPFNSNNGQDGIMFDIVALNGVEITQIDMDLDALTYDIEIYTIAGTHVGNETNGGAWTLLGTASNVTGNGPGSATTIPITFSVPLCPGQSQGFYVTSIGNSTGANYTNGTGVGNVASADANIQILEGTGKDYAFAASYTPRVFNGTVHYNCMPAGPTANAGPDQTICFTDSATMNASAGGVWSVVSGSGTFSSTTDSTATVTGMSPGLNQYEWMTSCPTTRDTVDIFYVPPVSFTINGVVESCLNACDGYAVINIDSGGVGPFTYSWNTSPVQSGDSASGLCGGNYTVTIDDNGCQTNYNFNMPAGVSCCSANAGTTNQNINGNGTNNYILCDGDEIQIFTNGDTTLPNTATAGLTYGIYTCPPTPGVIPANDTCFSGYVTGTFDNFFDTNTGGSSGGLLGALIGAGVNVNNNTLYYAPLTLNDTNNLTYDTTCYDVGPAVQVTYLEPITYTATENCGAGTWDVTISGGYPGMYGGSFTLSNLSPSYASLSTTSIANGGTVTVSGLQYGDSLSFDVVDGNGCPITVTAGPYTCCPANAGTTNQNINGNGTNNYILCDGDEIQIFTNADTAHSPGPAPGITYAIYTCPPTAGVAPPNDPCFSGYVTGTFSNFSDTNTGGSGGGLLGALIGAGVPVNNNTLYYAPMTLTDTNNLTYDTSCYDLGPAVQVTYLEPIVITGTEDCQSGTVTITISGGYPELFAGNYNIVNNGPGSLSTTVLSTSGDSIVLSGLSDGDNYSITVTDDNGCPMNFSGGPFVAADDATISSAGPFCTDDPSLNLNAVDSGGTWSGTGITDANNGTFDPGTAGAGNHIITYTISGTCGDTDTVAITVNQSRDATITPVGPFCVSDSAITINAVDTGGTWSGTGITNTSAGTFDPATAGVGTHQIIYNISGPCGDADTINISVNSVYDASINPAGPFCASNDSATLTATDPGGTWSGTGIINASAGTFDPGTAGPGNHTITYIIPGACGDTGTTTISVIADDDATITPAGPFCASDTAVNLTAAQTGGNWTGTGITNGTNGTFDPATAGAGTHQIIYSIPGACGDADTVNITVNPDTDATITPAGPFCESDPSLTLNAVDTGGVWSGPGITNGTSGTFDPNTAGPGTHTITYRINTMCGDTDTVNITVNPDRNASITSAGPFCVGNNSITLTAADTGGVWSGTGITDPVNGVFDPGTAGAGSHQVIYSIANPCGDSDTITINVTPNDDATITYSGDLCLNDQPVTLTATDPGGSWSGNGTSAGGNFDPASAGAGTHAVSYVIPGPCGDSATTLITVHPLPQVQFSADTLAGCAPLTVNFLNTTDPGMTGSPCIWEVNNNTINSCGSANTTFTEPGRYDVTLTVTSPDGCTNSATTTQMIEVYPNPLADFYFEPETTTLLNPEIEFFNQSYGGSVYEWNFGDGFRDSTTNPVHVYADSGTYSVRLLAINEQGCSDTVAKELRVDSEFILYVPNAFTPDADGENDIFMPRGINIDPDNYHLYIFDRWGEQIFESHNPDKGWNGIPAGSSTVAQTGVYVWMIETKDQFGDIKKHWGKVTLIK